jgi:hypothetical protein
MSDGARYEKLKAECLLYYEAVPTGSSFTQVIAMNRLMSMSSVKIIPPNSGSILSDYNRAVGSAEQKSTEYRSLSRRIANTY